MQVVDAQIEIASAPNPASPGPRRGFWRTLVLLARRTGPMLLVHAGAAAVVVTGGNFVDWIVFGLAIPLRGLFITVGLHRYFSHRSFKTSRAVQFVMAFFGAANIQNGALWWAAHHRQHHRHSDDPADPHSPVQRGFFWAHFGWLFATLDEPNWDEVRDLRRYPELVWLERFWLMPGIILAGACYLIGGWSLLCVGFCLSNVVTYHLTFVVNSLGHIIGSQRYATNDASTNSWLMALLTMGEGWHNNHHYYAKSASHGFFWWEIDGTFQVVRVLKVLGLVWDVHLPPPHILERSAAALRPAPVPAPASVDPPSSPRDPSCAASPAPSI